MSDSERSGLRSLLQARLEHERQIVAERYQKASRDLRSARHRVTGWKIELTDDELVARGFGRVYAAGRQALKGVQEHPDRLSLHTLRKEATYLRNIVEILSPNRVSRLQETFAGLKSLAADAGKCLDLQLLKSVLLQATVQASNGVAAETILRRIEERHKELMAKVMVEAKEIYRRSRMRQLRRMKVRRTRS